MKSSGAKMSIRKGKTILPRLTVDAAAAAAAGGSFESNDDVSSSHSGNESKERYVWIRTLNQRKLIVIVCLCLAAAVYLKVVLPFRSTTTPFQPYFKTIYLRKVLTESQQECSVWIAPSSLKGVNGYGTFTTRDLQAGEQILLTHDGLGIPIESYTNNNENIPFAKERSDWIRVWKNYWWARYVC
jgi:hypothetical protein